MREKLCKSMMNYWKEKINYISELDLFSILDKKCKNYLNNPLLLGVGKEGFVYKDGDLVKKFILNWSLIPSYRPNIDQTFNYLNNFNCKIKESEYFYKYHVKKIDRNILLIEYPFEESKTLSNLMLKENWNILYKNQVIEIINEMTKSKYITVNMTVKNFILVNEKLKFIDYGRDILPLEIGTSQIIRMYFMLLNDIYFLGTL
ncbi:hypothetical protein KAR04_08675 [Candidatus Calescamantes bacterium]|nr:hypothetical protein [Candidatus Calescamantes bacterium]MCK5599747.1 hypothetical protein [bacterium]